ncbi:hypothetical protein [Aquabacterium sp.]|uniref:hypothetical protein n=1 Tax=Aquabacterium sp. TaxID=1872578 RepID=UPI004037EE89
MSSHDRQHFEPMGLPVLAGKRSFDFLRVVAEPAPDQIRADLLHLAAELRRLGLDTLHGCKVKPGR